MTTTLKKWPFTLGQALFFFAFIVLTGCGGDDEKGPSSVNCDVASGTLEFGSDVVDITYSECEIDFDGEFNFYAESGDYDIDIYLPSMPTKTTVYSVLNSENWDGESIPSGKAFVDGYDAANGLDFEGVSGAMKVTVNEDGTMEIEFCSVKVKDFEFDETTTIGGKFGCN